MPPYRLGANQLDGWAFWLTGVLEDRNLAERGEDAVRIAEEMLLRPIPSGAEAAALNAICIASSSLTAGRPDLAGSGRAIPEGTDWFGHLLTGAARGIRAVAEGREDAARLAQGIHAEMVGAHASEEAGYLALYSEGAAKRMAAWRLASAYTLIYGVACLADGRLEDAEAMAIRTTRCADRSGDGKLYDACWWFWNAVDERRNPVEAVQSAAPGKRVGPDVDS